MKISTAIRPLGSKTRVLKIHGSPRNIVTRIVRIITKANLTLDEMIILFRHKNAKAQIEARLRGSLPPANVLNQRGKLRLRIGVLR